MLQSHGYPRTPLRSYGDPEMADPLRLSPQERQKGKCSTHVVSSVRMGIVFFLFSILK